MLFVKKKLAKHFYLLTLIIIPILFVFSSIIPAFALELGSFEYSSDKIKGTIDEQELFFDLSYNPDLGRISYVNETGTHSNYITIDNNDRSKGSLSVYEKTAIPDRYGNPVEHRTTVEENIGIAVSGAAPTLPGEENTEGGEEDDNTQKLNCINTVFGCIPKGKEGLVKMVAELFKWVTEIIGILSVLGLIYAGYVYITSAGNPDRITHAKDVIWTSIASLLIVIFAYALLVGLLKIDY